MKTLSLSQTFTRRQTLSFLALGAAGIATAAALGSASSGDDRSDVVSKNHKQSSSNPMPFVISF